MTRLASRLSDAVSAHVFLGPAFGHRPRTTRDWTFLNATRQWHWTVHDSRTSRGGTWLAPPHCPDFTHTWQETQEREQASTTSRRSAASSEVQPVCFEPLRKNHTDHSVPLPQSQALWPISTWRSVPKSMPWHTMTASPPQSFEPSRRQDRKNKSRFTP